ncbi:MAG TPA: hypothetical protein VFZ34_28770, partial [Blastocatellia bacterium]|nr:hypothetical protein [Blastocatellia bacterium]
TLTVQESDANTARVRRGHFIVDRVQDRDGKTDKLWVTSQSESGVGTELTVARNESGMVAGTSTKSDRSQTSERGSSEREVADRGEEKTAAKNIAATSEAAVGTVNQIAKFTSAGDLGNSVMTEQNGNIGIGTTNPSGRLHIFGSPDVAGTLRFQPDASKGANHSHVHWGATGDWYIRSAAAGGKVILQDTGGNVGIGTANPTSRLEIAGQDGLAITGYQPFLTLRDTNTGGLRSIMAGGNGDFGFYPNSFIGGYPAVLIKNGTGNVGIGTPSPGAKLHVEGGGPVATIIKSVNDRAYLRLDSTISGQNRTWSVENGIFGHPGKFGIYDWQANKGRLTIDTNGLVEVAALQITGGADFAEHFDVNVVETNAETPLKVQAGMVVAIDPASPGKLQLSTRAYDRRVAGIISGAGGVQPGMMMSQAGTLADGQHPVALSGRVYVWVDATRGAVKPGDLLTTSATPGHAMKATNAARAQGAIIGKAMTSLKEGKGLVLVLVTLQ